MRRPSPVLVVGANILTSAALGIRSAGILSRVAGRRSLIVSDRTLRETAFVGARRSGDERFAKAFDPLIKAMAQSVPIDRYFQFVPRAARILRQAVPSLDASASDSHVLAVASFYDADIWSHDRHFAGAGWPSWSSANLLAALAEEQAG